MTFTGTLYWRSNSDLLMSWDSATGTFTALTGMDPGLPSFGRYPGTAYGSIFPLGDGNLAVGLPASPGQQMLIVPPSLDLTTTPPVWAKPENTYWGGGNGYVGYRQESGVYDPATGLNWLAMSTAGTPWEWYGYANDGTLVQGRGDTSLIPSHGDAYLGGQSNAIAASLLGRTLYRNFPFNDGIARYNLDTDVWEAILPQWMPDHSQGFLCHLIGVDNAEGTFITAVTNPRPGAPNYGFVEVRDPAADPWVNPVPDGVASSSSALGEPLRRYDPTTATGAVLGQTTILDYPSGASVVQDGKLYFASWGSDGTDYGHNPDGSTYGTSMTFWAMTLADGTVEKIVDVPYLIYNMDGSLAVGGWNDPDSWAATTANGVSMAVLPASAPIFTSPMIGMLQPLRNVQRGDGLGIGGVPRAVQTRSQQSSARRGSAFL